MIRAVVVDDEQNSRELLINMLTNYLSSIEVVGQAHNVSQAIEIIQQVRPDLILLDIEMPGGNGFEVLNAFSPLFFDVIIITGYNNYRHQFPQFSFLLKPIDLLELETAVDKIIAKNSSEGAIGDDE